jgi:D-3-phosphoglycerate dehydrogenase
MTRKIIYPDADSESVEILSGERLAKLQSLGEFVIYPNGPAADDVFIERLEGANAAISGWGLSNRVLAALPDLEVVSFTGLGASTFIDIAEARRRNITVTHTLSAAPTIAEHCLGLMLDAARNISRLDRDIRKGTWNTSTLGMDLRNTTLGLVGFGRIAQALVPMAQALGMKVIAWTRNPDPQRAREHGIEFTDLDHLLATSDVVSLHLSSTPQTNGMLNAERLRTIKPGALLINTARSQLLDEAALVDLLNSGHIRAAAIDVFDNEPIAPDHPFVTMNNVTMTPHIAYNTPGALIELYDTAVDNLLAYYAGNSQNVASA